MPKKSGKKKQADGFSLISREKLLSLYAALLRCRMLEDFVRETRRGLRAAVATSAAAAVAATFDLKSGDVLAAAEDFLPRFARGKSVAAILRARPASGATRRARTAEQLRTALAAARRRRRTENCGIVAVFGAAGGAAQALLRTAVAERLPVLFVANGGRAARGASIRNLPSITVDRDDVVALYRVVSEGMAHARRGNGPTLIECVAWHGVDGAEPSNAMAKMEAFLAQKGIDPGRRRARVMAEFEGELGEKGRSRQTGGYSAKTSPSVAPSI